MKGVVLMSEEDAITKTLREVGPRYIADSQQRLVGFLLTPEEYEDYLEMCLQGSVIEKTRREAVSRYVVDSYQRPVGFVLTPEEHEDYLEMRLRNGATKQMLHEARSPYIVDASQQPWGFLLTPEEYDNYLALLHANVEQDAASNEITARLNQVYPSESSSLDPVVLRLQLASLDEKSW